MPRRCYRRNTAASARSDGGAGTLRLRISRSPAASYSTGVLAAVSALTSPRRASDGQVVRPIASIAGDGVAPELWHMLIERTAEGEEIRTEPLERPGLYKRSDW